MQLCGMLNKKMYLKAMCVREQEFNLLFNINAE